MATTHAGAGPQLAKSGREIRGKGMETLPCTCVVSSRYHVESCNFSPDGKLLATCFGDFTVRLLRIGEQRIVDPSLRDDHAHQGSASIHIDLYWVIKEHKSSVWCARFSPDGLLLCTCSSDKTAKIWNVNSQTLERSFDLHTDTVWSCCFAPTSPSTKSLTIATGSSDQTVKVWNTENGEVLHDLGGYGDAIDCLDFSSSGEMLCTSCRNGEVKIWMNLSRTEKVFSECSNTDSSGSLEPIYLDLAAVNRSASRLCMFSTCFSSYIKDSKYTSDINNEAAARDVALSPAAGSGDEGATRDEVTQTKKNEESDAMGLFPKSDPCELLFAGGPENTFAVWSVRDIAAAFSKNLLAEEDPELAHDVTDKEISTSSNTNLEYPSRLSQSEDRNEDGEIDDHVMTDGRELKDSDGRVLIDHQNQMGPGAQLRTITEEEEEMQSERIEQEDSCSQITDMSQETSTIYEEFSYISEEPFSFYKVEPRWTLTEHLSTVWDCCIAALNHNVISEGGIAKFNDATQVLISCSGDRTLRYGSYIF